jgi:hypothetical protein
MENRLNKYQDGEGENNLGSENKMGSDPDIKELEEMLKKLESLANKVIPSKPIEMQPDTIKRERITENGMREIEFESKGAPASLDNLDIRAEIVFILENPSEVGMTPEILKRLLQELGRLLAKMPACVHVEIKCASRPAQKGK